MSIPTIQRYRASILLATLLVHLFAFWLTKNRSGLKILTLATEPCSRVNKSVSICCTSHRNTKRSRKSFWLWLLCYMVVQAMDYEPLLCGALFESGGSRSSHWQQEASSTGSPSSPFHGIRHCSLWPERLIRKGHANRSRVSQVLCPA